MYDRKLAQKGRIVNKAEWEGIRSLFYLYLIKFFMTVL